jgi:arginyl-tRNA synthetase
VAFVLAKDTDRDSMELAGEIAEQLKVQSAKSKVINKVEVAKPGFINFWLSEHYLLDQIKQVLDLGDECGKSEVRNGEKVMVEFTDPNPFKEFHIGHLYSNIVGESLARLFEANGAGVRRANYQGDVGLHVAKALWGLLQIPNLKSQISKQEKKSVVERAGFLGKAYAHGATAYEEDENAKGKIERLNQQIYDKDPEIMGLYKKGRQWSLDYFETIYERLGTKFDFYYFEREAGEIGIRVVNKNLKKGVFEESEGAIIFPGEKYGLHTRVFVNSQGLPTYEAKDLGLAETKYKDFSYDQSVIVTGNEVDEYFRVVLKALGLINPKLGERTRHISHGMVKLPTGKMSSRTGEIITGEWLLDEAKRRVLKIIKEIGSLEDRLHDEVAEMVGIGAVKYALLKSHIGRDVVFDFEESVSFEGDSGPYLQYTYARAQSVLAKSELKMKNLKLKFKIHNYEFNNEEIRVLRWMYRFPEVVEQAGKEYAPSVACCFLYELAQRFNAFYNKHRILNKSNEKEVMSNEQSMFRLAMTAAVAQVIKNGLSILGIKAPRKM